jgi:hypothetical protein
MYLETSFDNNPIVLSNVSIDLLTETAKKNWLSYWKHFKRNNFDQCAVNGCTEHHQHGVLVKNGHNKEHRLYVVPVCCAHSTTDVITLKLDKALDVISADLSL